jgi:hypothetical protein
LALAMSGLGVVERRRELFDGEVEGRMAEVGRYTAARLICLVELPFRSSMTEMRVDTGRGRRIT